MSPIATLTGTWAVNDPTATNVAQIVLSGAKRHTPEGAVGAHLRQCVQRRRDRRGGELVTARFGAKGSRLTAKDVAKLREQTAE